MSKKSRARLWVSILTCEGLFATLKERLQWAPLKPQAQPSINAPSNPFPHDYAGVIHVHTTHSDGLGTVAEVAQAANEAGVDFVILNDHSNLDAITQGEEGRYDKTLVLVGTEITTNQGHLLALAVPPSLIPASNDAVAAQQAIQDSGGFGFIALPCDLKDHWKDFAARRAGIGLEVFNLSAIARSKISLPGFLIALLLYRGSRPQRVFHLVAARPGREIRLWDDLLIAAGEGAESIVGIGSLDAHAVMKVARRRYPFPTYEELFRTLRTHILTSEPLEQSAGNAESKKAVHEALASGHCYIAYDNYGDSTGFCFEALSAEGQRRGIMGDRIRCDGAVTLHIKASRSRCAIHLYRDGIRIAAARGGEMWFSAREPGVYRAEAFLYRRRIGSLCLGVKPWVFSNPIRLVNERRRSDN